MTPEPAVAGHYGRPQLVDTIVGALAKAGKDIMHLTPADLNGVDQFHVGGVQATRDLIAEMKARPGMHLLDVGCGLGGPARIFAGHGCRVTAVDLTAEFVAAAEQLTHLVGMDHTIDFRQASATQLPFDAASFDGAYLIHVGMNLPDKPAVFREVRRVLKPGATFAIFDFMQMSDAPIRYPVPWAATAETSFVDNPAAYRTALEGAGFQIAAERNRREFAIEQTERSVARMGQPGGVGPGLALLMGEKTPVLVGNMLAMTREGVLEPVELIAVAA